MRRILFLAFWALSLGQANAADYYWIGGAGNWNDLSHWRLGSVSGAVPSIVPSAADNVFFNAGAGFGTTAATKTVTLNTNGFCNNMDWTGAPNNPIFITSNAALTVEVSGNMVLSPGTTYTCLFNLVGTTPASITSNGTVSGAFGIEIDKPGSSVTVTDSLIVPNGSNVPTAYITLTAGKFDISGKKLSHLRFSSSSGSARTLEMTNATVTFTYFYAYTGANKVLNATGSTLNALGWIYTDGGTYNRVNNNAVDAGNQNIDNTTFKKFTFLNPVATSEANMDAGNTVDSLVFMSRGAIGSNNNVNVIVSAGTFTMVANNTIDSIIAVGSVNMGNTNTVNRITGGAGSGGMGAGNNVTYWQHGGHFNVTGGVNNIDSLLLTPGKIINFRGTFNVSKYLKLNGAICDAFSEVTGDSVNGSLNFAPGAMADMNNMTLTGLKAYGPVTPLTVGGIDNGGNAGFVINEPSATGTTLYWVGGSGDWNDRGHWSTTSGGTGGACVPYKGDNVVFDAASGLATGTVTTSGSAYCNNMTWTGVGNVTFNESATSIFRLYGSLVMDNSVTMNAFLEFHGTDSTSTITTNGNTLGGLQFLIYKTGNGRVTLMDNWNNPAGGSIWHASGGLRLAGRTVAINYYWSSTDQTRSLDITNADINVVVRWEYSNGNKTMTAAGSHITCQTTFITNAPAVYYPSVDLSYAAGSTAFNISGTQFGQLTFTATSNVVNTYIGGSNTIRRLEFKGRGLINAGGNTIDSLILAGSRNYFFTGSNTITQYLKAQSTPCAGLSEIKGSPTGTFAFSAGAVADMGNIYMQNMTATGPVTPVAFNGADAGGNSGWTINVPAGGPRYWVGGSGDWNDGSHWSASSGGAGGTGCVPTVYDDVYFDAGSGFTAASKTVTANTGNAYCRKMDWTGAPNGPVFSKSATFSLEIWGDLVMNPTVTMNAAVFLTGPGNTSITSNGAALGDFDINANKAAGTSLTFLDNYSNALTRINLRSGTLNLSGRTILSEAISDNLTTLPTVLNVANATITGSWSYLGANKSLQAAGSNIIANYFESNGNTYNMVDITATNGAFINISSTAFDSLLFSNPSLVSGARILGGNSINYLEYKGSGNVAGTGNTINKLVFFPGKIYTFSAGTTTNITGEWFASGTPCNLTEIVSSSTTANATINKTGGAPAFDYIRVRRITGTGATPFIGFSHTTDQGNNTNWNIAPYNGAAPIYGLGPDTSLPAAAFPYTLRTDGFFGNPSSQYLWNNSTTADSLVATGPGTYGVNVSFVDGCNISDNIVLALRTPLPLALTSFTARAQDCRAGLNWKIARASNFSHFVVERSEDGLHFSEVETIPYAESHSAYVYTDRKPLNGTNFYRLKLADLDGTYVYSTVVALHTNCGDGSVQVYPTITSNTVHIALPQGYEDARIYLQNIRGQYLASDIQPSGLLKIMDIQRLAAGTYLLHIEKGTEHKIFRIMKQ